jgi:hypothetical protein
VVDRPRRHPPAVAGAAALRLVVTGLLVVVPLVFDPRQGRAGARPKLLVLLVGAATAAALLAAQALAGRRPWAANFLRWPVVALVAWAGLSTAASAHRGAAVWGFTGNDDGLCAAVALAVVLAAAASAFDVGSARRLMAVLWFGTGTCVLAFGLGQLADRLIAPDRGWDWARPSVSPWTIGSTLGNPNHLASFLAMVLPIGVVLAVLGGRRSRLAAAGIGAAAVAELGVTASRGGLVAAAAGLAVLAVLLRRELGGHRAVVVRTAAGAVAVALVAAVVLGAAGASKRGIGALAKAGPGSTVDLRREVWAAAWRVALDHPVIGVGPDVFPVVFPAYAGERFHRLFGPFTVANGAHNLFLNTLADEGAGGLAALVVVLGAAATGLARAWAELSGRADAAGRHARLLLAGLIASLVAYLVQAQFNTQAVALSACCWALLGVAVALAGPRAGGGAS